MKPSINAKPREEEMNTLTIHHRGQQRRFRLTDGGYQLDSKGISIAIQTFTEDDEAPYTANFGLINYPTSNGFPASGIQLSFKDEHLNGWDDITTHANASFDFHVQKLELRFTIQKVEGAELTVELWALTEEYGYDGDDTPPNPITGRFRLFPKPKHELWIPT